MLHQYIKFKDFEKGYGYEPKFIEFKDIVSENLKSTFSIDIKVLNMNFDNICNLANLTGFSIEFIVQDNLEN